MTEASSKRVAIPPPISHERVVCARADRAGSGHEMTEHMADDMQMMACAVYGSRDALIHDIGPAGADHPMHEEAPWTGGP